MKHLFLLPVFLLISCIAYAKVFTVDNRPGSSAQYTNIAAAITAAAAGDTIYIHGSETNYGNINVDKRLVFIGPGHNPQKDNAVKASIGTITLSQIFVASGSVFLGLEISYIYAVNPSSSTNNITIERCNVNQINGNVASSTSVPTGWVIENNIIGNVTIDSYVGATPHQFIINNNIITSHIGYGHTCFIRNNTYINGITNAGNAFQSIKESVIENNIFFGTKPEGADKSTFNNNLTYGANPVVLPYGTNYGTANINNADPLFTNFPLAGTSTYLYDYDLTLQAASPAKSAGTDGTDLGVYGGTGFTESGEPAIPQVQEFVIKNGVVAPGGKLNITIKAEAKN